MKHNKIIQREFSKQALRFGDKGLTLSSQDILAWIVDRLPLDKRFLALDVAAGTGHLSLAIAPYVKRVFALDITREMLTVAHQESEKRGLHNISLEEGSAENLPYVTGCFDLVVSRLSLHHFENPITQLQEMVRVCKDHYRIGIIDLLSPEDARLAEVYNNLERLRDPSHTVALAKTQMEKILMEAGIVIEKFETRDVEVDFERWVQMTGTKPGIVDVLREELVKEMNGGSPTGMRPFLQNGSLKFLQVWSIWIGIKTLNSDVH